MRRLIPLVLMLCWLSPVFAQDEPPPYLYYYTDVLNAFVIERADGSDSRTFGAGLTPSQANVILGPRWSPDGHWFAWYAIERIPYNFRSLGGQIINIDNTTRFTELDRLEAVERIEWGPDGQRVIVRGCLTHCDELYYVQTYWLFEVQTQHLLASFEIHDDHQSRDSTIFEWSDESVSFYDHEFTPYSTDGVYHYYHVLMSFNGTVLKQAVREDEYDTRPRAAADENEFSPLDSPSGRYVAGIQSEQLVDTVSDLVIPIYPHSDATSFPLAAKWHSSETWVIFGYNNGSTSTAVGGSSVMSVDGQTNRELGSCGFDSACIDWLPSQVDTENLAPGSVQSVLLAPLAYDYGIDFSWGTGQTREFYVLACDENQRQRNQVQNASTLETIFILPRSAPCSDSAELQPFSFALSPDGTYYVAVADAYLGTMGIYDVQTGERLFALNTYGFNLHFSADGTQLIMRSRNAVVTWDVAAINEAIAQRSSDGE